MKGNDIGCNYFEVESFIFSTSMEGPKMLLKVDCLPDAVGKQLSIPLKMDVKLMMMIIFSVKLWINYPSLLWISGKEA